MKIIKGQSLSKVCSDAFMYDGLDKYDTPSLSGIVSVPVNVSIALESEFTSDILENGENCALIL